jgi:hypothetical protein
MTTNEVKNATIGKQTRGWLSCIAQLDELYNSIYAQLEAQYIDGKSIDEQSRKLCEPYNAFRSALLGYMTENINDNLNSVEGTEI